MHRILSVGFIIFTCLNVANSQMKQCYFCNSENAKQCSPEKIKEYDCSGDNVCFSFAGLNTEKNEPFFFRGCYEGDCQSLEKRIPVLKAHYCKSCKESKCNNEKLPDIKPM